VHEGKALNPVVVVDQARCILTEYDKALLRPDGVVRLDARQSVATPVAGGWRPPGLGLYKVNWAIFLDLNSRHCLLGSLVRDHERCVLGAMVMKLPLLPCGIHSTVGAVLYTLKFASVMGFGDIVITPFLPPGFSRVSTSKTRQPEPSRPDLTKARQVK
jgi:hypothetical protein